MRTDLNMRRGKQISQGCHASMKVILDNFVKRDGIVPYELSLPITSPQYIWLNNSFTKICLQVDSEAQLDELYEKALQAKIPAAMIIDNGKTEFNGIPTKTAVAIGPHWSDEIDIITGHLKLL
jgi:PTH2 family peptidyl-tRNA hydrolase